MKTCTKCGELNGESRIDCWKCKSSFGPLDTYKKICKKCGMIFPQKAENCDKCGERLSVYSGEAIYSSPSSDSSGCWMYVVAALIPIVGIILGCIYIARHEDELGKSLILTSIVVSIIATGLGIMMVSCSAY